MGWQISIETADDVEIAGPSESDLLQLKLRAPATTLTDAGTDLWKTIRVWSEGIAAERFEPTRTNFVLVTTASVTPGSAISMLLANDRDPVAAVARLKNVAQLSGNQAHKAAYDAFLTLSEGQRQALFDSVTVLPGASDIAALEEDLRDLCAAAVRRDQVDAFLDRLEGWWFRRCLKQLSGPGSLGILAEELDSTFTDLREQFRETNLPIDWDIDLLAPQVSDFDGNTFVHQLRLASISDRRIGFAVRDYLRAFTQRSRWSREGLLLFGELDRYERRLIEEWERVFERVLDDLGTLAAEEEKVKAAREVYAWVESSADFHIRPDCNEPFVTRGSFHLLADDMQVGWHPDFLMRLVSVLEPAAEVR